jgi:hypothetical protein
MGTNVLTANSALELRTNVWGTYTAAWLRVSDARAVHTVGALISHLRPMPFDDTLGNAEMVTSVMASGPLSSGGRRPSSSCWRRHRSGRGKSGVSLAGRLVWRAETPPRRTR